MVIIYLLLLVIICINSYFHFTKYRPKQKHLLPSNEDFNFGNIIIDEKSYENILVYKTSYKTLIEVKPLHIRINKVHGFIRVYDGTRYLVLFDFEKYHDFFKRIRYLIEVKIGIIYGLFHNYAMINVHSYDFLPLKKALTFHNVMIHIKSVLNKDHNHYYYNIFLEEHLCQLLKKAIVNKLLYKL